MSKIVALKTEQTTNDTSSPETQAPEFLHSTSSCLWSFYKPKSLHHLFLTSTVEAAAVKPIMRIEDGASSFTSLCEGERGPVIVPEQETRLKSLVPRNSDASEDGLEDNDEYKNSPTHLTAVLDLVATPIPRVDMHLRRVRSPDYFRTQYLSNLGIWAHDRASQRISAEPAGTGLRHYVPPGIGCVGLVRFAFVPFIQCCLSTYRERT